MSHWTLVGQTVRGLASQGRQGLKATMNDESGPSADYELTDKEDKN